MITKYCVEWSADLSTMYTFRMKVGSLFYGVFMMMLWVVSGCGSDHPSNQRVDDEMSAGEMSAGEMSAGEMSTGGEVNVGGHAGTESDTDEPWIKIGTGFRRFEELSSGQEVPIIAGIQGGFHVWGGFVGRGFDDLDVRIVYSLDLGGMPYAAADYTEFELPRNSRSEFEYAGVSVIYFQNDDVEVTSGQEMTLKLAVITRDGFTLRDEQQLIPICCE